MLSGGLDSTTVAAQAQKAGFELTAITLRYGQKHSKEVDAAKKVAKCLGIRQEVIDVSFFKRLAWYSALTGPEAFDVPRERDIDDMAAKVPITYVPLRNTFFITTAAAFLESRALDLIEREQVNPEEVEASVFIAANAIDYSGYPDCRPEYYEQMSKALFLGSKLGTEYGRPIVIQTPIILKTKAEIVKMAMEMGVPLEHTWSCYEGGEVPCGKCDSCILRAKGFSEAGYEDPLIARLGRDGRIPGGK
ncbi:MAG: 7-cyano-7-deazaguanine synthase [Dehalococcoidia bacterium]|nr:7-cyano-7-deazaguanine synthase [Dehalococcoidia bacterium]